MYLKYFYNWKSGLFFTSTDPEEDKDGDGWVRISATEFDRLQAIIKHELGLDSTI